MISQLIEKIKETDAPTRVGLDPTPSYVPGHAVKRPLDAYEGTLEGAADTIWQLNKEIVDHTRDLVPAVKLQTAMYEQFGIEGFIVYKKTTKYYHEEGLTVIRDAKQGDIGSTSAAYATGYLGTVQVGSNVYRGFDVDMLMANPYLETDGVKPFVDVYNAGDEGPSALVKTSNPNSGEFQDRSIDGRSLYEWVAQKVMEWGATSIDSVYGNVEAVAGAIYSEMDGVLRKLMPATYFLVPEYGAQGGMMDDLKRCSSEDGFGVTMNSSRGVIAAYRQDKCKQLGLERSDGAFRQTVPDMVADINSVL